MILKIWLRVRGLLPGDSLGELPWWKLVLGESSSETNGSRELAFLPEDLDATFDEGLWPIQFLSRVPDAGLKVADILFWNIIKLNWWHRHASNSLHFFTFKLLGCLLLTQLIESINGCLHFLLGRNQ